MYQPKTIEELKAWFKENGYEPARTRFFVGVDFRAPKAFGIYKNEFGEFVVYKNKADGTRAIRYQGDDEEFAVHELYQRFQEEIINQQTRWTADNRRPEWDAGNRQTNSFDFDIYEMKRQRNERGKKLPFMVVGVFLSFILSLVFMTWLQAKLNMNLGMLVAAVPVLVMVILMFLSYSYLEGVKPADLYRSIHPRTKIIFTAVIFWVIFLASLASLNIQSNGYYSINNNLYYRAGSDWYRYDDSGRDWELSFTVPSQLTSSSWRDYNNTGSHHGSYESFESTSYYTDWIEDRHSYSESRDNDDDYDSGSWSSDDWDSGYTDWNSDW